MFAITMRLGVSGGTTLLVRLIGSFTPVRKVIGRAITLSIDTVNTRFGKYRVSLVSLSPSTVCGKSVQESPSQHRTKTGISYSLTSYAIAFMATTACMTEELGSPVHTPSISNTATTATDDSRGKSTATPVINIQVEDGIEITGIESWINSDAITIGQELEQGRAVLVDFWTYTCVNCIRTLPFLKDWYAKYTDLGLTIVGIHSPEFDFEKLPANVLRAIEDNAIEWPVALDNDRKTWSSFTNRFWPAKYLFGPDGSIRYRHFGEGAYLETEYQIRSVLQELGQDLSNIPAGVIDHQEQDPQASSVTREIYGGYERSYSPNGIYAGQESYYLGPDKTLFYTDDGHYTHNQYFLQGVWRNEREAIVHARATATLEDYLAIKFAGRSVNVVINPLRPEPFDVFIEISGRPLKPVEAGRDVRFDDNDRSFIRVEQGRMYSLVELPDFGVYVLKLISASDNLAIHAFTFGVYMSGI